MKGERRRRQAQPFTDLAGGQPSRPGLDEQAIDIESGFLRERAQGG